MFVFFLEFVFFAMSFSLQSNSISSFSVFKIRFWRDDNFKVYVSEESAIFLVESKRHNFARMNENEDEKKTTAYDEDAFKGTLRLSFCSIFDLKGIFFHKHQSIFQVGRLPWQRLFVWIAEPIAAKQTIYLNRFFPYMKYGRQIVLSFQLKLSTQKKNKRSKQYNPFEPPNVPILFIEQTIK